VKAADVLKLTRVEGGSDEDFALRNEYLNPASLVEYKVDGSRSGMVEITRHFIGPLPVKAPRSLHGRVSRGAPIWPAENKIIRYLKDTWRISLLFSKPHRSWCKGEETKRLRASRAARNDVERGGVAFMDKMRELVKTSDA
jgi:hypothetical protein